MGRSRGVPNSAEEELGQRSKRKKGASSGENVDSAAAGTGTSEGKRALYHCNYCNKDISGKIRIKCVMCPDFDLCIECFSVGAEITPHKSNHPYRVMDNLSFPLIGLDWNADEEILLLEGIEMYGLGNWTEVAEHVGTKSKAQCIEHYTNAYMNSPCFPLPDMSHVVGKNRKELLDMAKGHGQGKKGFPNLGELTLKEETTFSPSRVKAEESGVGRSPSTLSTDADSMVGCSGTGAAAKSSVKKAAEVAQVKAAPDAIKLEDRSIGVKKPKSSGEEGPSLTELSGYNPKRQEFDPEYDNDAEKALADMEFKDTDTEEEREIKLEMLRIYSRRLDERKRRKDFILERNLLRPDPRMKELDPDERELYRRYNVFMRFHSQEEHEKMMKTIIKEHRIRKYIKLLQEAREAGCRTASELDRFMEQKKKQEAEEAARKAKESGQVGPSGKAPQRGNRSKAEPDANLRGGVTAGTESSSRDASSTTAGQAFMSVLDDWDVTGLPGADLLSPNEEQLCNELKLIPAMYLKMKEVMSVQILQGNITKKSDAHSLFKVDTHKIDRVFDMLAKAGVAPP